MAEHSDEHPHHDNRWYLQDESGQAVGPFTSGQVQRWLLLGRLEREAAVSPDDMEWGTINDFADELVPAVMKADLSDPHHRDRLEAARRWADERTEDDDHLTFERRADPTLEEVEMRRLHNRVMEAAANRPREHVWWLFIVLILLLVIIGYTFLYAPVERDPVDCDASPAARINWTKCDRSGIDARGADLSGATLHNTRLVRGVFTDADLSGINGRYVDLERATLTGANLQDAVLLGANLRRADLRRADLSGADLSYADLTDATLTGVKMEGATLHRTTWVDGLPCLPGSTGECRR